MKENSIDEEEEELGERKEGVEDDEDQFIGQILFNKYKLIKKIGQGCFGSIYEAQLIGTNKYYAIKFEDMNQSQYMLENESYFLSYLNIPQIPKFKSFGYTGSFMVLIMELLGKSLDNILNEIPNKKLSLRCVCNIAYQLLTILELIHDSSIIHRDIKPGNIAVGGGERSKYIYLLDFGLSAQYRDINTKKHFPFNEGNKLIGNARYSSINSLKGGTQSPRDDLESLGYLLIYLLLGKLPWQGYVSHSKEDKYYKIKQIKEKTTPEQLCQGLPNLLANYINYTRSLKYEDEPNYNYLKKLFLSMLDYKGLKFDFFYDWNKGQQTDKYREQYKVKNYDLFYYKKNKNIIPSISKEIKDLINERKSLKEIFGNNKCVSIKDESDWIIQSLCYDSEESSYSNKNDSTKISNENKGINKQKRRKNESGCCLVF